MVRSGRGWALAVLWLGFAVTCTAAMDPAEPVRPPEPAKTPESGKKTEASKVPESGKKTEASKAPESEKKTEPAKPKFEMVWNNALFIQSTDKSYSFHLGGLIHYDAAWYSAADALELFPGGTGRFHDGVAARRLQLRAEGTIAKNFDYLLELEFAHAVALASPATPANVVTTPAMLDAWVTATGVPLVGNVRVGNQREPFGLDQLLSSRNLPFMERSYLSDVVQPSAFNVGRSPGVSLFRTWRDDRIYSAIGAFKNISDPYGYGVGDGQYAVTGRLTYLPIHLPDQQVLWHVGGSASYRDPVDDQVRVRSRSAVRAAPGPLLNIISDTGLIHASSQTLINFETASSWGPVTVQGEYLTNLIHGARVGDGPSLGTMRFQGYYVQALVFLTGEHRTWNAKTATFARVVPRSSLGFEDGTWVTGPGAWEVGVRYTFLDRDTARVTGGHLHDVTIGLNWYLNPNMKLQFNYDYLYRDGGRNPLARGSVHAFGTRLALDF